MQHKAVRPLLRKLLLVIVVVLCAGAIAAGLYIKLNESPRQVVDQSVVETPKSLPVTIETASPAPTHSTCSSGDLEPFVPESVRIEAVGVSEVRALNRTQETVDGKTLTTSPVPPDFSPSIFAWDRQGAKPGSLAGNMLLTAHTYSDGSALGNQLYKQLRPGDVIVIEGDGQRLCVRVTERREVPVEQYPTARVFNAYGRPQVVITVCSGLRLGPGDWAKRTLWFAEPM